MSRVSIDPTPVNDALRRLHRSAIASLALCAVGVGVAAFGNEPAPRDELGDLYSWIALALAATAILTRRSVYRPARSLRSHVYSSLVSLMAATGLGILGLVVALREEQTTVALLYTLAGALLVLRAPAPLVRSES
jgi:hypothetical protein